MMILRSLTPRAVTSVLLASTLLASSTAAFAQQIPGFKKTDIPAATAIQTPEQKAADAQKVADALKAENAKGKADELGMAILAAGVGAIPEVGPFLSPLVGFLFPVPDKNDRAIEALRTELKKYVNDEIADFKVELLDDKAKVYKQKLLAINTFMHSPTGKLKARKEWSDLEARLREDAESYLSKGNDLAAPRILRYAAAINLHLDVLAWLIEHDPEGRDVYVKWHGELGEKYNRLLVAECRKTIDQRIAKISIIKGGHAERRYFNEKLQRGDKYDVDEFWVDDGANRVIMTEQPYKSGPAGWKAGAEARSAYIGRIQYGLRPQYETLLLQSFAGRKWYGAIEAKGVRGYSMITRGPRSKVEFTWNNADYQEGDMVAYTLDKADVLDMAGWNTDWEQQFSGIEKNQPIGAGEYKKDTYRRLKALTMSKLQPLTGP